MYWYFAATEYTFVSSFSSSFFKTAFLSVLRLEATCIKYTKKCTLINTAVTGIYRTEEIWKRDTKIG